MKYLLTRESARAADSDERLAELIPPEGLSPRQVAALPIPAEDRHWALCYAMGVDDTALRLHAVWCTRRALLHVDTPDQRSVHACDVAERFALGQATVEELRAAREAARDAARDAPRGAAWAAATAAWALANLRKTAARATASAAASAPASAAAWPAYEAAWEAEREAQVSDLVTRITQCE